MSLDDQKQYEAFLAEIRNLAEVYRQLGPVGFVLNADGSTEPLPPSEDQKCVLALIEEMTETMNAFLKHREFTP